MTSPKPWKSRKSYLLPALGLLGLLVSIPREAIAQDTDPFLSLGEEHEVHSDVLGEARQIIVGLPAGYADSDESYPVVYLLDGPGHFHHTTGTARFLAGVGRMPGVIVVAISNTDRTRDMTPPTRTDTLDVFPTAGGVDNFLEFIGRELGSFIDDNYRTRPFSILIGHSFGGLVVNYALVHRPEMFNAYVSISPSLWWDDQSLVAQADSAFDGAGELVGDFYMTMGNEGGEMLGGGLKFAGVLEAKAPDSFRWEFNHMDEEDHGSVPHRSTYYGLEKIFAGWHLHDPVALYLSGGLPAIDRYFERATERFGYERSVSNGILIQVGTRAIEDEDGSEAHTIFSRIVEGNPNSAAGQFGLGEAQRIMGNEKSAIERYLHALSLDPRHQQARQMLTERGVDLSDFPENIEVPIELLESYVGRYSDSDTEYGILLEEQKLFAEVYGGKYELYPVSSDRFKLMVADVVFTFNSDDDGLISGMTIDQGGETSVANRIR